MTEDPLDDEQAERLVAAVRHESLPCPARGLELVVLEAATARAGRVEPGFELNLNTGRAMAAKVERHGETDEPHWYAIDRAILAAHGVALAGSPATTTFVAAPRDELVALLAASLRWQRDHPGPRADEVLNACRSLRFAREGAWSSKSEAGRWTLGQPEANASVSQALTARRGEGTVDGPLAAALTAAVLRSL